MSKKVQNFTVVADESEVKLIREMIYSLTENLMRDHFLKKGISEEELDKNYKFDPIICSYLVQQRPDGYIDMILNGISQDVEVTVE